MVEGGAEVLRQVGAVQQYSRRQQGRVENSSPGTGRPEVPGPVKYLFLNNNSSKNSLFCPFTLGSGYTLPDQQFTSQK